MRVFVPACLFLLLSFQSVGTAEMSVEEIVDRANKLLRGQSSHSLITMTISTPKWERSLKIEAWNQGRNRALMKILSPAKERGNGTLKIEKELWNWLPSVERVIKIPPSMMHSSWMGSDFTYEDVVKADSIVKDYTHKFVKKEKEGRRTLYVIESVPKPDAPVVWGKIILEVFVEGAEVIPLKDQDYSERGEHMRTLSFSDVRMIEGRRIPTRIECAPLRKPANRTVISYHQFDVDLSFPPDFFGLSNLRKPLK
jgi:outer membrane lipoprotein-sorting protein